jgi:hypothetical protein
VWCWVYRGCEILQDEQQDMKVYRTPEVITGRGWYRTGFSFSYMYYILHVRMMIWINSGRIKGYSLLI